MFVPPLVLAVLLGTGRLFDVAATRYTYRTLLAQAQAQALVVGFGALYVLGGLVQGSGFDRPPG